MTGTPAAAVFFSLLAVLLILLGWVVYGRPLRSDQLRWRIYLMREELIRLSGHSAAVAATPEYRRLMGWLAAAEDYAPKITGTRVLLCAVWHHWRGHPARNREGIPPELERIGERITGAILRQALPCLWFCIKNRAWREEVVEAVLASAQSAAVDQPFPPE